MVRDTSARRVLLIGTVLLLIGVAAGAGGCVGSSAHADQIRATILRYDELLTEGYRTFNMSPMREVASELQSEDEYIHMSSLAEGGIRLDPQLKDIVFKKVSVEGTSGAAVTRETWDYKQYDRTTGKLVLEQKGLVYDLAWDLVLQPDGKWLVTDVRAIDATTTTPPSVTGTITVPSAHP